MRSTREETGGDQVSNQDKDYNFLSWEWPVSRSRL